MKNYFKLLASALFMFIFLVCISLNICGQSFPIWEEITPTPAQDKSEGIMLLLSDGSVMSYSGNFNWERLKPDQYGSYINGTWSPTAPMHKERFACSSVILKDGRLYVAGGEFGTGTNSAEIYDPVADTWTLIPTGFIWDIADGSCEILEDGKVLQGIRRDGVNPDYTTTTLFDPVSESYNIPLQLNGSWAESPFLKLPDNSILVNDLIDNVSYNQSERYIPLPTINQWIMDADLPPYPDNLYLGDVLSKEGVEMGAALMLPDGRAFFTGMTGHTAYYTPSGTPYPGTWAKGPDIQIGTGTRQAMADAPMAMMSNGKILCAVSPFSSVDFTFPTSFYEFDYTTNAFADAGAPTGADSWNLNDPVFGQTGSFIFLNLPDGSVLVGRTDSYNYWVCIPEGPQLAAGKPTISAVVQDGCTNIITGTLFNGISEGSCYNDENQNATNYPIVRLTATDGSNKVYYCRTSNWNSTGIQRGSATDNCEFTVPATCPNGVPDGTYDLYVIANGISSDAYHNFVFSSSCSADLWMMDNPVSEATQYKDFGFEPDDRYNNAPDSYMWISGDIWVSPNTIASPWGNFLGDQSISYDGSTDNYIYVTIRNRGCSPSSGTETLDLHWTKSTTTGVGDWKDYWDGTQTIGGAPGSQCLPADNAPFGGLIVPDGGAVKYQIYMNNALNTTTETVVGGDIPIPAINPSEFVTFQIPWLGVNPLDYFCLFPGESDGQLLSDEDHFCLLARIQTSSTAPYGMTTYPEGNPSDVWTNTYNNKKIAWHNVSVVCAGCRMAGTITRNPEPNPLTMKLTLSVPPAEIGNSFLNYGTVKVDLGHNLFQKWIDGDSIGYEVEICNDTLIRVTGPNAWIGNITLDSLEADVVEMYFDQYIEQPNQCQFNYDIAQYDSSSTDTSAHVTGGVRFLINTCSSSDSRIASASNKNQVESQKDSYSCKVYPNPTTGKVTVIYHLNSNNGMLQLYDMIGQMVGSYQLDSNSAMFEFDIADLCCGIFSYRVTDGVSVAGQGRLVIVK